MFGLITAKKMFEKAGDTLDTLRAGWTATRKSLFDSRIDWTDKLQVFTEVYKKEMEKLKKDRGEETQKAEDEVSDENAETEGKMMISDEEYEFEDANDESTQVKATLSLFEDAVNRNMKAKNSSDLASALKKLKTQPSKEPEEGHDKALTDDEMAAFTGATLKTWLDLMYDKKGNRLKPKDFALVMKRLFKSKPGIQSIIAKFTAKNFKYAFTKLEDTTKLGVLQKAGVDTDMLTEGLSSDSPGSQIGEAVKALKGSGDLTKASSTFHKYFFKKTPVKRLVPILTKIRTMMKGSITPHDLAFVLYNIDPRDLKTLASNMKHAWKKKGVHLSEVTKK